MTTLIPATGVRKLDRSKAYDSLIGFSALDGATHLIRLDGTEVKRWDYVGLPGNVIDPKLNAGQLGHVLVLYEVDPAEAIGIFGNKTVAQLDWDGNVVWKWGDESPGGRARQNHDWTRLANGNTLLLITRPTIIPMLSEHEVGDQGLVEVTPEGKIVWSWMAADHLDAFGISQDGIDYIRTLLKDGRRDPWGLWELNNAQVLGPNKWHDAGHAAFHPDNIIVDSRKGNFIVIIDKQSGTVMWRAGPYSSQDENPDLRIVNSKVPRPLDQTAGQHNVHLIAKGLPGEGNLLMLDNQGGSGYPPVALGVYAGSRVIEVNPVTRDIVWQYTAEDSGRPVWSFFTSFVGSVQRLPNGNTLINEGMNGRIFQVAPDGEIVWEYINAYPGYYARGDRRVENPMVYRAQAVPFHWVPTL